MYLYVCVVKHKIYRRERYYWVNPPNSLSTLSIRYTQISEKRVFIHRCYYFRFFLFSFWKKKILNLFYSLCTLLPLSPSLCECGNIFTLIEDTALTCDLMFAHFFCFPLYECVFEKTEERSNERTMTLRFRLKQIKK